MHPRPRLVLALLSTLVVLVLVLVLVLGGHSGGSPSKAFTVSPGTGFDGAALPAGIPAPEIALTDQYGRRVSLAALRGQVIVVSFLYSHCGAPCVVIAQQIRGALDELRSPASVLIVSLDPAGDTPAKVGRFLARVSLSGRVHYLSGTRARLRAIWQAYRVITPSAGPAAFAAHASVLLIDPRGEERVLFQSEQLTPEALSHDIARLQKG